MRSPKTIRKSPRKLTVIVSDELIERVGREKYEEDLTIAEIVTRRLWHSYGLMPKLTREPTPAAS